MTIYHEHHLTPTHAGGSDNETNKVRVPVVRHAMFHFSRWQLFGDPYDRLAWKGLAGIIDHADIVLEVQKQNGRDTIQKRLQSDPNCLRKAAAKATARAAELWKENPEWAERERVKRREAGKLGGAKNKGKKWYYNSQLDKESSFLEHPGEGWVQGRKPGQRRRKRS